MILANLGTILASFAQMLGVFSQFDMVHLPELRAFFEVARLFTFDIDILRIVCLGYGFAGRYLFRILTPAAMVAALVVQLQVTKLLHRAGFMKEPMHFDKVLNA